GPVLEQRRRGGADDAPAADRGARGRRGDDRREVDQNFERRVGLETLIGAKEQAGPRDVFRQAWLPVELAGAAVQDRYRYRVALGPWQMVDALPHEGVLVTTLSQVATGMTEWINKVQYA